MCTFESTSWIRLACASSVDGQFIGSHNWVNFLRASSVDVHQCIPRTTSFSLMCSFVFAWRWLLWSSFLFWCIRFFRWSLLEKRLVHSLQKPENVFPCSFSFCSFSNRSCLCAFCNGLESGQFSGLRSITVLPGWSPILYVWRKLGPTAVCWLPVGNARKVQDGSLCTYWVVWRKRCGYFLVRMRWSFLNRCFFPIEINISYSFVYIKFTMPATSAHLIVILNRNFWTQTEIHKQCPRSLVSWASPCCYSPAQGL